MNGVMFPGNSSALPDRNVNGPATPRPVNRSQLSLSGSITANGLADSTDASEQVFEQTEKTASDSLTSETVCSSEGMTKGKHGKDEESGEEEEDEYRHNAKRLKFDKDAEEENEARGKEFSCHDPVESSTDMAASSLHVSMKGKDASVLVSKDQELSSTQSKTENDTAGESVALDYLGSSHSNENDCEAELSEHKPLLERLKPEEIEKAEQNSDSVSSTNSSGREAEECHSESGCSSPTELVTEGNNIAEDMSQSSDTAQDSVEQG